MQQYITPNWPAPKNVVALTSLRNIELKHLNLPAEPFWIKQVHGNNVVRIDQAHFTPTLPEADAAIAFSPNNICMVRTADCLPVFLCDQQGTQVAVIHCGWRSLAANIIAKTCGQFTAPMQDCLAWVGPAIGPNAFEVGKDVLEAFAGHGWDANHIAMGFKPKPTSADNRLLSKLAVESKVLGDAERRTGVYTLVHEDSSTASTTQFAATVEFGNNRLLSKLAVESKVLGDAERRTGVYTLVHEDSSTASTTQFAATVEFGKKSNEYADKWFGDLYTLARLTLSQHGIPAENIYGGEWCTYSDPERFYSYRRSKDAGRMFNLIWLKD